jgi:hypothetical protein
VGAAGLEPATPSLYAQAGTTTASGQACLDEPKPLRLREIHTLVVVVDSHRSQPVGGTTGGQIRSDGRQARAQRSLDGGPAPRTLVSGTHVAKRRSALGGLGGPGRSAVKGGSRNSNRRDRGRSLRQALWKEFQYSKGTQGGGQGTQGHHPQAGIRVPRWRTGSWPIGQPSWQRRTRTQQLLQTRQPRSAPPTQPWVFLGI